MALHAKAARRTCFYYTVRDTFFTELVRKTATEKGRLRCTRRQQTDREFYFRTDPQYSYGLRKRNSRLLCMRVTVWLRFENITHRQQAAGSALALKSGHKHVGFQY